MLQIAVTASPESFDRHAPSMTAPARSRLFVPGLLIVGITATLACYYWDRQLGSDVAGQLWLARFMNQGGRLYVDHLEINPPLWFWMAMPFDAVARHLRIAPEPLVVFAIGVMAVFVVRCARRLLPPAASAPWFLAYLVLILLVMPIGDLEQREHLALIASIPLLLLASARRTQQRISPAFAAAIAAAAALGLALKPQFAAVPLSIELWLACALKRQWRPLRPENLAMAAAGGLYVLAIVIFTPIYFSDVVARVAPIYQQTGPSLAEIAGGLPELWLVMMLGLAIQRGLGKPGTAPITTTFVVGWAGFAISFAAQHKGWLYQGLPATACLALALAALFVDYREGPRLRLVLPALMSLPLCLPFLAPSTAMTGANDISPALQGLVSGDRIGLISTLGLTEWSAVRGRGLKVASRYGTYWSLAALDHPGAGAAAMGNARRAVAETAEDYRCTRPQRIIFTRSLKATEQRPSQNPEAFFRQDPAFVEVLDHYSLWKEYGVFRVYLKASSPPAPVDPAKCLRFG